MTSYNDSNKPKFGEIALSLNYIDKNTLNNALEMQQDGEPWGIGYLLYRLGALSFEQITEILFYQNIYFHSVEDALTGTGTDNFRIGELAVASQVITYAEFLRAIELQQKMKDIDGKDTPLGKVLIDLKLMTEEQLKMILTIGGVDVYKCRRCNRIYNVKKIDTTDFCCPFCHFRFQDSYDTDVINIEGNLQIGIKQEQNIENYSVTDSKVHSDLGSIGNYSIIQEIGAGRMGIVSKAKSSSTTSIVALKALIIDSPQKEEALNYFEKHKTAISSFVDYNITRLLDYDKEDDLWYMIYEHFQGIPLDLWVRQNNPSYEIRLKLLIGIAKVLSRAHKMGIYHLNLHPGNILIDENDNFKITDFGIPAPLRNVSTDNTFFGADNYVAPELNLKPLDMLDDKIDQFALGCIAYELFSGELPFPPIETTDNFMYYKRFLPELFRNKIPYHLQNIENVIFKSITFNPELRFNSMGDFAEDLTEVIEGNNPKAKHITPFRRFYSMNSRKIIAFFSVAIFLPIFIILYTNISTKSEEISIEKVTKPETKNNFDKFKKIRALIVQTNYELADKYLDNLTISDTEQNEYFRLKALLNIRANKIVDAEIFIKQIIFDETDESLIFMFCKGMSAINRQNSSIFYIRNYLKYVPQSQSMHSYLLSLLAKNNNWNEIISAATKALAIFSSDNNNFYSYLTLAYGMLKKWKFSEISFQKAIANNSDNSIAYFYYSKVLFFKNTQDVNESDSLNYAYQNAEKAFSINPKIPFLASFLQKLKVTLAQEKIKLSNDHNKDNSHITQNHTIKKLKLLVDIESYEEAVKLISKINVSQSPQDDLITLAKVAFYTNNFLKSLEILNYSKNKFGFNLDSYILFIKTYNKLKLFTASLLCCDDALTMYPDSQELLFNTIETYIEIEDYPYAIELINKFEKTSINNKRMYHIALTHLYQKQSNLSDEKVHISKLLEIVYELSDSEIIPLLLRLIDLHKIQDSLTGNFLESLDDHLKYCSNPSNLIKKIIKHLCILGESSLAKRLIVKFGDIYNISADVKFAINELISLYNLEFLSKNYYQNNYSTAISDQHTFLENSHLLYEFTLDDNLLKDINYTAHNANLNLDNNLIILHKYTPGFSKYSHNNTNFEEIDNITKTISSTINPLKILDLLSNSSNLSKSQATHIYENNDYFACDYISKNIYKISSTENTNFKLNVHLKVGNLKHASKLIKTFKDRYFETPQSNVVKLYLNTTIANKNFSISEYILLNYKELFSKYETIFYSHLVGNECRNIDYQTIIDEIQNFQNSNAYFNPELWDILFHLIAKDDNIEKQKNGLTSFKKTKAYSQLINTILTNHNYILLNKDLTSKTYDLSKPTFYLINILNKYLLYKDLSSIPHLLIKSNLSSTKYCNIGLFYIESLAFNGNDSTFSINDQIIKFIHKWKVAVKNRNLQMDYLMDLPIVSKMMIVNNLINSGNYEKANTLLSESKFPLKVTNIVNALQNKLFYKQKNYDKIIISSTRFQNAKLVLISKILTNKANNIEDVIDYISKNKSINPKTIFQLCSTLFNNKNDLGNIDIEKINKLFYADGNKEITQLLTLSKAMLQYLAKNTKIAKINFQKAMKAFPDSIIVRRMFTKFLFYTNNLIELDKVFKLTKKYNSWDQTLKLYYCYYLSKIGNYQSALQEGLELIKTCDNYIKEKVTKILLYLTTQFGPETNKKIITNSINANANSIEINHYQLVFGYQVNDIELLKIALKNLSAINPDEHSYKHWLIWAYIKQQNLSKALNLLNENPEYTNKWKTWARKYCILTGNNSPKSLKKLYWQEIEQMNAKNTSKELLWAGTISMILGENIKALELLNLGLDIQQDNLTGLYNMSILRKRMNRLNESLYDIKKIINIDKYWLPGILIYSKMLTSNNKILEATKYLNDIYQNQRNIAILGSAIENDFKHNTNSSWIVDYLNNIDDNNLNVTEKKILGWTYLKLGITNFNSGKFEKAWKHFAQASRVLKFLHPYSRTFELTISKKQKSTTP